MTRTAKVRTRIHTLDGGRVQSRLDALAGEEPLELRLKTSTATQTLTVTMRTSGHDFELAAGWLLSEGLITAANEIKRITYCSEAEQLYNTVNIELQSGITPGALNISRSHYSSSACGVCGKGSLEQLSTRGFTRLKTVQQIESPVLYQLPEKLHSAQGVFQATGGLHAAALFSFHGKLLALREDIGRHNAVDKLIGHALMHNLPLEQSLVLVSGRAGFEIVQKCIAARVPILASISAPSSLAVALAKEFNLSLVGFLRGERCNVYHGLERIRVDEVGNA